MRQRGQSGTLAGRDQQARGQPDRLVRVVVLDLAAVGPAVEAADEHGDQPGRHLQERLVGVGSERAECREPVGRCTVRIELALLRLGRRADAVLDARVRHRDEPPGLLVGARWRGGGRAQALLDQGPGNLAGRKITHAAATLHVVRELTGADQHLLRRVFNIIWQRHHGGLRHDGGSRQDGGPMLPALVTPRIHQPVAGSLQPGQPATSPPGRQVRTVSLLAGNR